MPGAQEFVTRVTGTGLSEVVMAIGLITITVSSILAVNQLSVDSCRSQSTTDCNYL
jgi:hypothetical protein